MKVLLTGATGFVGSALVARLRRERQLSLRASVRRYAAVLPADIEKIVVSDMEPESDWKAALDGVSAVVHLAARVHVMHDKAADPLEEFRWVNVAGTLNFARQSAAAGVRRFVFLSSIKVNGEAGRYTEEDTPAPSDPYGVSKYEAELGLWEISRKTRMEVVVIRPPLVYGPGVKANFLALMRAVACGYPLPFGAVHNQRSMVAVDNLADFILKTLEHPRAANETFVVSDGEDLSTTELIVRLAVAVGRKPRLISVPAGILMGIASLVGKRAALKRLLGSLSVDSSKALRILSWTPPISVDEGLRRVAASIR